MTIQNPHVYTFRAVLGLGLILGLLFFARTIVKKRILENESAARALVLVSARKSTPKPSSEEAALPRTQVKSTPVPALQEKGQRPVEKNERKTASVVPTQILEAAPVRQPHPPIVTFPYKTQKWVTVTLDDWRGVIIDATAGRPILMFIPARGKLVFDQKGKIFIDKNRVHRVENGVYSKIDPEPEDTKGSWCFITAEDAGPVQSTVTFTFKQ